MIDIIVKGGIILLFILVLSVFAIALIVERILYYSSVREKDKSDLINFIRELTKKNRKRIIEELEEKKSPAARVLLVGVKQYGTNLEKIKSDMEAKALQELALLERNVSYLLNIANVATLLGLLGTVTGMIMSFFNMKISGVSDPSVLAGGIAQALVTTAAGLSVAIPSLFFYHLFANTVDRQATSIEIASSEYISFIAARYDNGII